MLKKFYPSFGGAMAPVAPLDPPLFEITDWQLESCQMYGSRRVVVAWFEKFKFKK